MCKEVKIKREKLFCFVPYLNFQFSFFCLSVTKEQTDLSGGHGYCEAHSDKVSLLGWQSSLQQSRATDSQWRLAGEPIFP